MNKKIFAVVLLFLCIAAVGMGINMRYPVRHTELIKQHAGALEPTLIFSVIKTESGFRPHAKSHKNAMGLMQLTEGTAGWMAEVMGMMDFEPEKVWEPEVNIAIGAYYLNWLVNYYKGDLNLALCAYNAGMGNVNRWLADTAYSEDGVTLHTIPFPETDQYVQRVRYNQKVYAVLLKFFK